MKTKRFYTPKLTLALMLMILAALGVAGCGSINVGVEPTPKPEILTYTNTFYGFEFEYPVTWSIAEKDHGVILTKGTVQLGINFRWIGEDFSFGRTGFPAGTPIYSGKISFMGQVIPENRVELDHLVKYILYSDPGSLIEVGDLAFMIVLEDLVTDYMTLDLPEEIIQEAKLILETFKRIEAEGSLDLVPTPIVADVSEIEEAPHDGWIRYTNTDYGFSFWYPSEMSLVEEANHVKLEKDALQLVIAFRRAVEDIRLVEDMTLTGKYQPAIPMQFLGAEIPVFLNTFDGLVKTVYFGNPGMEIEVEGLRFVITLLAADDGFAPEDFEGALAEEIAGILASFGLVETE